MIKPKIIFFGTSSFVIPVLEVLRQNFELVAVVTAPDREIGRKKELTASPVAMAAAGVPTFKPEQLDDATISDLKSWNPDLIVVASYGKIIPQAVLDLPKFGALNIHPSLLPKYRGASPMPAAILAGDKVSGISIIKMDAKMDHGPIVYQEEFKIPEQADFDILSNLMFRGSAEVLASVISDFVEGKVELKEQDHSRASFCKLIKKEDGYFEITTPPSLEQLDRMIRAYYPWPTAWTKWNDKIIKFLPGSMIQLEGKNPVKLEDFLRGYPEFPIKSILSS